MDRDPTSEGQDVIDVLTRDHREIEAMLRRLGTDVDAGLARVLVATLVRHAVAEEEYVYPAVRDQVPGGDRIVDRGVSQHAQVEETMQQIAGSDTTSPGFRRLLSALAEGVSRHVRYDESELFPRLRRACTKADLARLGGLVAHLEPDLRGSRPGGDTPDRSADLVDQIRAALSATPVPPAGDEGA